MGPQPGLGVSDETLLLDFAALVAAMEEVAAVVADSRRDDDAAAPYSALCELAGVSESIVQEVARLRIESHGGEHAKGWVEGFLVGVVFAHLRDGRENAAGRDSTTTEEA